jgi:hypothetical protein
MRWTVVVLAGCSFHARAATPSDAAREGGVPADVADAAVDAIDAAVAVDFVIEAEAFTQVSPTGSHAWTRQTAVAGASAMAYMQITPADGAACDPVSQVAAGCATAVSYAFTVPVQATYYVHVRMYAVSASEDSVWFGFDGTPDPTNLSPTHDSAWHWVTSGGTFTLAAGPHTLTLWQREAGARADIVAITRSPTPPPP